MCKPRVLYLPTPSHTKRVFTEETFQGMRERFDVTLNETEVNYTTEGVAQKIRGFDGLVTGWGTPPLTGQVFENADRLRVIAHSAGSVRWMLEEALKYAEHPSNAGIAIFQGLINIWNLDNCFVRTLAPLHRMGQDAWEKKLANYLDAVFCYGHNVMIRVKPVLEVGGFVTDYISEDFGTAVKLADRGYKSRFVPLHTYEALPENIRGFIKRQGKWTRGSMEFFDFVGNSKISSSQKVLLSSTPLGHISYIFILSAMFLTIFGYVSTIDDFNRFVYNLWLSPILYILSIPVFRYAIALKILSSILLAIKLYQLKISCVVYLKHQLLSKAIGAIMLPYEVRSIVYYLLDRKRRFPVTPKNDPSLSFQDVLKISGMTLLLIVTFTLGLAFLNPLGVLYNISWLLPFYISPVIIYLHSKAPSGETYKNLFGYIQLNGGGFTISCSDTQQNTVHVLLSLKKLQAIKS